MSQRALKKRDYTWQKGEKEIHQPMYRKQAAPTLFTHRSKYIQRSNGNGTKHPPTNRSGVDNKSPIRQRTVVKHKCSSTPNLTTIDEDDHELTHRPELQRSHSESDLSKIPESNVMAHAKSEFHLTSIASTHVASEHIAQITNRPNKVPTKSRSKHHFAAKHSQNRSSDEPMNTSNHTVIAHAFHHPRALRPAAAAQTATSPSSSSKVDCTDSANIRIPIIGFEVMEERARFTVNQFARSKCDSYQQLHFAIHSTGL